MSKPRREALHESSLPFLRLNRKASYLQFCDEEKFCDKPNQSILSRTLEAILKIHASKDGVSTIARPKLGCGLDQMNWQEVLKLLCDNFDYAEVQVVVYTLEEYEVHAMSSEGNAEF